LRAYVNLQALDKNVLRQWLTATIGGEGGIRTHGADNRTTAFETAL